MTDLKRSGFNRLVSLFLMGLENEGGGSPGQEQINRWVLINGGGGVLFKVITRTFRIFSVTFLSIKH